MNPPETDATSTPAAAQTAALEQYAERHTREPALLTELAEQTHATLDYPDKLSGRLVGRLIHLLAQLVQPKLVLDIGMFSGYSALSMAEALGPEGRIISFELNPKAVAFAKTYFERSPHGAKIEIRFGAAMEHMQQVTEPVDMVFIDADKRSYLNYFQQVLPQVRVGGLIIIDNALWQGNVLRPVRPHDFAVDNLNKLIVASDQFDNVLLPLRDGVNIVRKRY